MTTFNDLLSNIVAWYKLDETSGTTVKNEIGSTNGISSRDTSLMTTEDGQIGRALNFNGTDNVNTGQTFQSTFRSNFTITFWHKLTDGQPSFDMAILGINTTDYQNLMYLAVTGAGQLEPTYDAGGNGGHDITDFTFSDGPQNWQFVCFEVIQSTPTECKMYIYTDGTLVYSSNLFTGTMIDFTTTATLQIGGESGWYVGSLDNFMIFNKALSQEEITFLYNWDGSSSSSSSSSSSFNSEVNEYGIKGGRKWYYTQDKPGTDWFDKVDNNKGWTVDFNLTVNDIVNNMGADGSVTDGAGIYVNDGNRSEVVSFLTQEIIFKNANQKVVYDTTGEVDYRLIGKKDSLKLFAKRAEEAVYNPYSLLAEVPFKNIGKNGGNGHSPALTEGLDGDIYAVWADDGNGTGQIYYSVFSNGVWLDPIIIVNDERGANNPIIIMDNESSVYVVYEAKMGEATSIGMIYKNGDGFWSNPYYLTENGGQSKKPKIVFDSLYNLYIVSENYGLGYPEIFINKFSRELQKWEDENRLTTTLLGAYTPSISSYLDNLYITYSVPDSNENSIIRILKYNVLDRTIKKIVDITPIPCHANNPSIMVNVAGKVVVVWDDDILGRSDLYGSILNLDLDILQQSQLLTDSFTNNGGNKYPVLSEQIMTGNIYIAWQDFNNDNLNTFSPSDMPYMDPYGDPYNIGDNKPIEFVIRVSYFDNLNNSFLTSANGGVDTLLTFEDERSVYSPSLPLSFSGDMPILYEICEIRDDDFLKTEDLFTKIGGTFYNNPEEIAIFNVSDSYDDDYVTKKDYFLSSSTLLKEIRFGDFSDNIDVHYVFKNMKYYLLDAVEPFYLREVVASNYPGLEALNALDAVVNNYGDAWVIGTCGARYYCHNNGRLLLVAPSGDIETSFTGIIRAIAFDKNNVMYVGNADGIYYSSEHIRCFTKIENLTVSVSQPVSLEAGAYTPHNIYRICFDQNNRMLIGVNLVDNPSFGALYIINLENNTVTTEYVFNGCVSAIKVDDNNIIWVGTYGGLYRIQDNSQIKYTTANGLSSNYVNDIAIRNTAIRYIATSNGISKMMGSGFANTIKTDNSNLYANNVKSVLWQEPNILWAGTLSVINQIVVNDIEEDYNVLIYTPSPSTETKEDNFQLFYILTDVSQTINPSEVKEVYLNGNLVSFGYTLGKHPVTGQDVIWFEDSLKKEDIVEVVVRKDLILKTSFKQSDFEKTVQERLIRIKKLQITDKNTYIIAEGDENEIKVDDANSNLPFDRIHLDTHPPDGTITIPVDGQIDKTVFLVNITATDTFDNIVGSGVESMIISNYPNFTSDGSTPQLPVPFASTYQHDLGINSQNVLVSGVDNGKGESIIYVEDTAELFYTTSQPGHVFKLNVLNNQWDLLFSYGEDYFVDFVVKYNTQLIISVGHPVLRAQLYIYDYVYDNEGEFQSYSFNKILFVSESRLFSYLLLDNVVYLGTGIGAGTEYAQGEGEDGGKIYLYDGTDISEIVREIDDNVYGLSNIPGETNIQAVTGESGFVYEVDPVNKIAFPVHNDVEALASIAYINYNNNQLIFVGGNSNGIIRRSVVDNNSFDISFRTVPSKVSVLKVFSITEEGSTKNILYAAVGNIVYYLSEAGSWTWKYTHSEEINDITMNTSNNYLYVISDSKVVVISPITQDKRIYLKLIDRAGNSTDLYDATGQLKENLTASISISDLIDFVNENKIFELDTSGNVVFNLKGNNSFYSANRIDEEKGVYISEVFDGTNNLVKWESFSWQATELHNTSVLVYLRSSNSKNDILLNEWLGPYYNNESIGVDIGHFSGQFIQFKVELISREKGITPTFHRAVIRVMTSEAIHFFTTNFILPSKINKGILTSQKKIPVLADVVFAINTTNSVDWNDYQIVEENRLFNVNQIGKNIRIGIKFISPNRNIYESATFDEYGPYNSGLYVNTIDFSFINSAEETQNYHFKVTLYSDINLEHEIYSAYSFEDQSGFSVNGIAIAEGGTTIPSESEVTVLFSVPGSANIKCNTYYFVKIEAIYDFDESGEGTSVVVSEDMSYIASCGSSFIDVIDFNFTNHGSTVGQYDFRIRFYRNPERTTIYKTVFSQNDRSGWLINNNMIEEEGVIISPGEIVNIIYRPETEDFTTGTNYYITIDAWDNLKSEYVFTSASYTFQVRDITELVYCGGYVDVPVVKNFGIMVELENNQFMELNL